MFFVGGQVFDPTAQAAAGRLHQVMAGRFAFMVAGFFQRVAGNRGFAPPQGDGLPFQPAIKVRVNFQRNCLHGEKVIPGWQIGNSLFVCRDTLVNQIASRLCVFALISRPVKPFDFLTLNSTTENVAAGNAISFDGFFGKIQFA
jgi:hypothetical protein